MMKVTLNRSRLPELLARTNKAVIPGTQITHEQWLVKTMQEQGVELEFTNEFPWHEGIGNQHAHRLQGG